MNMYNSIYYLSKLILWLIIETSFIPCFFLQKHQKSVWKLAGLTLAVQYLQNTYKSYPNSKNTMKI